MRFAKEILGTGRLGKMSGFDEAERFEFGKNWQCFQKAISEEHIAAAEISLKHMLDAGDLKGKSFLDVGSGSGLHSLVARRLGAKVHSFDYDRQSVACTAELQRRYFPDDTNWTIEQGNILDTGYITKLDKFDIVYSWGVLHHTGNMQLALENVAIPVRYGGKLFISIYNDQGRKSEWWKRIKKTCNAIPGFMRLPYMLVFMVPVEVFHNILKPHRYVQRWRQYKKERGMSLWHDWRDWIGGYPFEVANPEMIFNFYRSKGFILEKLKTVGAYWGCNEFVFLRVEIK